MLHLQAKCYDFFKVVVISNIFFIFLRPIRMMSKNTTEDGFLLLGFYEYPDLQVLIFFMLLLIYFLCLLENIFLIGIIYLDLNLHTPMYFFLCNLSFLDICWTTLILPKFLLTFLGLRFLFLAVFDANAPLHCPPIRRLFLVDGNVL